MKRELVQAVREMMERHWDPADIAIKLGLTPELVRIIIDTINNTLT